MQQSIAFLSSFTFFYTSGQLKHFDMLEEVTRTKKSILCMTIFTVVHGSLFDMFQQQTRYWAQDSLQLEVELKFYPMA